MAEPTVTSKNLPTVPVNAPVKPAPPQPVPEPEIIAKPLVGPSFTEVKSKNPNLAFRWVNRAAGSSTGQPGMRMDQLIAVGFLPATPNDCVVPGLSPRDGKFIYGDLILMKISRAAYLGALKYNEESARFKVSNRGVGDKARATMQERPAPPELTRKISFYQPELAEVEKAEAIADSQSGKP